jgi:acyl dehydratase
VVTDAWACLVPHPGAAPVKVAFADLPALEGREFTGDWFTVDPDRLALFDHASYIDENVNALDSGLYPERLVEGFHLLSILDHLINPVMFIGGPDAFGWNYGLDRVRFVSPVHAGDPIRIAGRVERVTPKGAGFLLLTDCRVDVADRTRPGLVAQWWVNWVPPRTD